MLVWSRWTSVMNLITNCYTTYRAKAIPINSYREAYIMLNMTVPDGFSVILCVTFRMGLTKNAKKINDGISCEYLGTVYESKLNIIIYDLRATDVGLNSPYFRHL